MFTLQTPLRHSKKVRIRGIDLLWPNLPTISVREPPLIFSLRRATATYVVYVARTNKFYIFECSDVLGLYFSTHIRAYNKRCQNSVHLLQSSWMKLVANFDRTIFIGSLINFLKRVYGLTAEKRKEKARVSILKNVWNKISKNRCQNLNTYLELSLCKLKKWFQI